MSSFTDKKRFLKVKFSKRWSERSARAALGRCGIIFLSSSFWDSYFSPRRGCPRVMNTHSLTLPPSDKCAEKIPLVSMGGRAEGQACTDP